jgi:hypothetical protein
MTQQTVDTLMGTCVGDLKRRAVGSHIVDQLLEEGGKGRRPGQFIRGRENRRRSGQTAQIVQEASG